MSQPAVNASIDHAPEPCDAPPAPRPATPYRDPESRAWLDALHAEGPVREAAVARLYALLLRAARFEAGRRARILSRLDPAELDDIAVQSAGDALVAVLAKLDRFRGESRFTTWAYKFALLETAVKLRRRPWQEHEILLDPERWPRTPAYDATHASVERADLLAAVAHAIRDELTPHQREVLVAVAVNGIPIDVLAERLGSTRGALYKTIHDARGKLRARLEREGHGMAPAREGAPR